MIFRKYLLAGIIALQAAFNPPAHADGTVKIADRKASATSILARLKPTTERTPSKLDAALKGRKLNTAARFGRIPRMLKLAAADRKKGAGVLTSESLAAEIKALENTGLFEYAEPDWIVSASQTPADAALSNGTLWGISIPAKTEGWPVWMRT
jgi:hypothetical protein